MKYLKLFEGKRRQHTGFRDKQKNAMSMANLLSNFAPSTYIVFRYKYSTILLDEQPIVFGRITKHEQVKIQTEGGDYDIQDYIVINVIDFVKPDEIKYFTCNIDQDNHFRIQLIYPVLSSTSLKEVKAKYEEIAGEQILDRDAKKYNM